MKRNFLDKKGAIYFKKWQNQAFSIFSTLGKLVIIGVLPVVYVMLLHFPVFSQNDTVTINEVVINSKRNPQIFSETARVVKIISSDDIQKSSAESLDEVLEYALGVDVRQRGAMGVQSDVSIRGGSFEQVLVLINGVKVNDSQTGHHSLNIPIDLASVERIEILEGAGARVYGTNAYSGAINIITHSPSEKKVAANFAGGQFGFVKMGVSASYNYKKLNTYFAFSHKKSSGYADNSDFDISNLFLSSSLNLKNAEISLQAGVLLKDFGAMNFYTPKYPYQAEEINSTFVSLSSKFGKKLKVQPTVFWRRHQDRFELFREDQNWYTPNAGYWIKDNMDTAKYVPGVYQAWNYYRGHNYHSTNTFGADVNFNFSTIAGKTSFGIETVSEQIQSNVLGKDADKIEVPFYEGNYFSKSKTRNNASAFVEHFIKIKKLSLASGILLNLNSDFGFNYYTGIDASYNISKPFKIFASVNQAMRMPTFNDLYYSGPSNVGSTDLVPEEAVTYELGAKFLHKNMNAHTAIFHRRGKNTIDWVKETEDQAKWQTMNYTNLYTYGAEFSYTLLYSKIFGENAFLQKININYQYLLLEKDDKEIISKYVFDYLVHNASASMSFKIYKNVGANLQISYQDRAGSFEKFNFATGENLLTEYSPLLLADARVFWKTKYFRVYADVTNISNTKYYDINNVQMPGTWAKVGVDFRF